MEGRVMFLDGVNIFRMRKVNVDYDGGLFLEPCMFVELCPPDFGSIHVDHRLQDCEDPVYRASDYQHYPQSK